MKKYQRTSNPFIKRIRAFGKRLRRMRKAYNKALEIAEEDAAKELKEHGSLNHTRVGIIADTLRRGLGPRSARRS